MLYNISVKNLTEFIPKKLSDKSAILFLHLRLQKSLNFKKILSLYDIPISKHFDLQNKKTSSSLNIGIFSFKL